MRAARSQVTRLALRALGEYMRGPEHPFKQRLLGHLRRRMGFTPVLARVRDGALLALDERDYVQRTILHEGAFEPEVWEALAAAAAPGDVVWDVGAHIGGLSVRALLDERVAEVHAFEPDPALADSLERNLRSNGRAWRLHRVALASTVGARGFRSAPATNRGLGGLASSDADAVVECTTVDALVFTGGVPPPTLLKLDVEGAEAEVLAGAARTLAERPPRAVVLEDTWRSEDRALVPATVTPALRRAGFEVRHLPRRSGAVEARENFLAVAPRPRPPSISVIIPTYRRAAALVDALRSVAACDPPPREVIVVDQTVPPVSLDREALGLRCPLHVLWTSPPGAAHARNVGARASRGDVLLFLDDDVLVERGLVGAHAANYLDPTVHAVGGWFTEPGEVSTDDLPAAFRRRWTGWMYFPHAYARRFESESLPSGNGSIRRDTYFRSGGFDERFTWTAHEDTDLSARLRRLRARIVHDPEARLVHLKVPTGGKRPRALDSTVLADRHAWEMWTYFYWMNFGLGGLPDLGRRLRGCVVRRPNVVRPWRLARGLAEVGVGVALGVRAMRAGRLLPLSPEDPCASST